MITENGLDLAEEWRPRIDQDLLPTGPVSTQTTPLGTTTDPETQLQHSGTAHETVAETTIGETDLHLRAHPPSRKT